MPTIISGQPPVLVHVTRPLVRVTPGVRSVVHIDPATNTVVAVPGAPVVRPDVRDVTIHVNAGYPGPPGPPGPGNQAIVLPCGEPISAGRAVRIEDDQVWYFDATDLGQYGRLAGVSVTAASTIGNDVTVMPGGIVPLGGLTPDARYFANGSAGQIGTVPGLVMVAPVGYAVDADTLFVGIETQLERG